MNYTATITDFQFHPMVEVVDSYLDVSFDIHELNISTQIREQGSIEYLSNRYGFKIVKGGWDFGNFIGKKCTLHKTETGFIFIDFLDQISN